MTILADGDIFESGADALAVPVNCVGVMGKGMAAAVKERYPGVWRSYSEDCRRGRVRPGGVTHHFAPRVRVAPGKFVGFRYVVCVPTKRHWRDLSQLQDVRFGLEALALWCRRHHIESVAVPALGCGLGGLDWADVRPLAEEALARVPRAELYAPR